MKNFQSVGPSIYRFDILKKYTEGIYAVRLFTEIHIIKHLLLNENLLEGND